ncbi:hypothetical protein [Candidatus Poriferisodalis sp.]|uniref:hypothetical protein n=1 Tax=Candidatus Poriferisodalis sp. TaxID=3101277 RepID=UPI003B016F63
MTEIPRPMSRRRFLAIVGGAGGAAGIAGLVGWRAIASADGTSVAVGAGEGVLAVEVESGFVGAAGWRGDLLTLRPADGPNGGMLLRAELSGVEHQVETPDGFAGRCVGVVGNTVAVCGHRVIETGRTTFETGTDYQALIVDAGPVSELLMGQPVLPQVSGYTYVLVERFASVVTSPDLETWEHFDLPLIDDRGGSFGAVLSRSAVLAADHYAIAEVPDSVFETALINLAGAARGQVTLAREPIPIHHGSLWGGADDGTSDLVIVSDQDGIRAYDSQTRISFSIDDGSELLGVNVTQTGLNVTVATVTGEREVRLYRNGAHAATTQLADDDLVQHRIAPDITIAAPHGQYSLVPNSQIARPEHA